MNTTTAGRCNVYYRSVKLSVTFHSNHGITFLSETGSSTAAIFDAFRTTYRRNYVTRNTTHLWGGSKNGRDTFL